MIEESRDNKAWPQGAPEVGQQATRTREVLPEEFVRFTDISGDKNPLHYDSELARSSLFGEIIVQRSVTNTTPPPLPTRT